MRDDLLAEWRIWRDRSWEFSDDLAEERIPLYGLSSPPEEFGWHPDQLSIPGVPDEAIGVRATARFGPFRDPGDVALITEAIRFQVEGILTTDLRFWRHRAWLYAHGIEIWRPTDYCWASIHEALLMGRSYRFWPTWPDRPLLDTRLAA